jgi:aspartate racemase
MRWCSDTKLLRGHTMIGVIGGMGPLATADFLNKVIEETGAADDEGHVPLLISCDPRIPNRPAAISSAGESPLPRLREIRDRLLTAGATALVMPCNTAHYWHAELSADCPVPFLSIVEAGCNEALRQAGIGAVVGVLGTRATVSTRMFNQALERLGLVPALPTDDELEGAVLPAIAAVKAGKTLQAADLLRGTLDALLLRGTKYVVLACTELPLALAASPRRSEAICIDTTRALARATVAHWREGPFSAE